MSFSVWKNVKIKDVAETIFSGGTPSTKKEEFWNGKINWLSSGETRNKFIVDTEKKITQEGVDNSSTKLAKKKDVVIASAGQGFTRGQTSMCLIDTYINQSLICVRAKKDIIDPYYLFYNISSRYNELRQISDGHSIRGSLTTKLISDLNISLPTIDEQRKIREILFSIDNKIETNNEINKKLEEMAQAIFKQWFVDFEFPNEDGKPYKSSGGEMVESELGIIPEGWKIKELKEVIKFNKGKKPKIITDKEFDNSKLYLTIDVLNRNSIQYAINDKVVLANKKDILMVMDGASSGSLYYGLDGIVGSTLSKLVINDEYINDDILYYFLKLNEFNIKGHLTGSAIPHTDKEYVNRLIMCIPNDKELLVRVTKILSDIREKVIINNEENSRLIKLRDILLPKLMSGEIRIPLGHE